MSMASTDPTIRFLKWFFGVPLLFSGLAAIAIPPVLAAALIFRGAHDGLPSWIVLGGLSGAIYLLLVVSLARRGWAWLRARPK